MIDHFKYVKQTSIVFWATIKTWKTKNVFQKCFLISKNDLKSLKVILNGDLKYKCRAITKYGKKSYSNKLLLA